MTDENRKKIQELGISEDVINQVLFVAKRMDDKGLVNSFAGNISAKVDGKIYITPTGQNKGLLTPEKMCIRDRHRNMIITVKEEDHQEVVPIAKRFEALGYRIYATRGTAKVLKENGIKAIRTNKLEQPAPNLMDLILGHKIDVVIDTPPQGVEHQKDGFVIRRNAIETGVNVLTSLDTAEALVTSLENTDLNNLTLIDIATIDNR